MPVAVAWPSCASNTRSPPAAMSPCFERKSKPMLALTVGSACARTLFRWAMARMPGAGAGGDIMVGRGRAAWCSRGCRDSRNRRPRN